MKITALVHTYNSELYLHECLNALTGFDEILICDMYSTDSTLEIARSFGCRIIFHENTGFVEPARNFALAAAKYDWVLIVDSDEIAPAPLTEYLYNILDSGTSFAALTLPIMEYFMGHSIRSSYSNKYVRFVNKNHTDWLPTIHSKPIIDGVTISIPASRKDLALKHYSNPSLSYRIAKINNYSDKEVERKRGKSKYSSFWSTVLSANVRFFKSYILKGGWRDGRAGFAFCTLEFYYKFIVLFKIWEDEQNKKG